MIQTMKKLKSGYINGTRVMLGNLGDFLNTSAITDLSFLGSQEDGYPDRLNPDVQLYLDEHLLRSFSQKNTLNIRASGLKPRNLRRRMSCKGAIRKTRSINCDSDNLGMESNVHVNERRLSTIYPPPWLEPKQLNTNSLTINVPFINHQPLERPKVERSVSTGGYDAVDEGKPPNKIHIHQNDCEIFILSVLM